MKGNYNVIDGKRKGAERTLAAFCRATGRYSMEATGFQA